MLTINHDNQVIAGNGLPELTASSGQHNRIRTFSIPEDVFMGRLVLINAGVGVAGVAGGAGVAAEAARSRRSRRARRARRARRSRRSRRC